MPRPKFSRRRYYAALAAHARSATWEDMGGKSLVLGLILSVGAGLLYLVLTGNQDDPVLGIVAVFVAALVLFVIVFVIHLVLAPARWHERVIDSWEASAAGVFEDWRETIRTTTTSWNESNAAMGHALQGFTLFQAIDMAQRLGERLEASETLEMADDGQLRAFVDAWDGRAAQAARSISEAEAEFYLRNPAVPVSSGQTWQSELMAFLLMREGRLEEILRRFDMPK